MPLIVRLSIFLNKFINFNLKYIDKLIIDEKEKDRTTPFKNKHIRNPSEPFFTGDESDIIVSMPRGNSFNFDFIPKSVHIKYYYILK